MFALRSAVALTCLVAAAGRRHSDSYLTPEVGQAEEKTAEALESITHLMVVMGISSHCQLPSKLLLLWVTCLSRPG